jgi:hypothetical protein
MFGTQSRSRSKTDQPEHYCRKHRVTLRPERRAPTRDHFRSPAKSRFPGTVYHLCRLVNLGGEPQHAEAVSRRFLDVVGDSRLR